MRILLIILALACGQQLKAQKVDSIYFHLYTDSLKKGFYNYINVDGLMSDGTWSPLDSTTIFLISDGGFFKGNDLYVDSSYQGEFVHVKAVLKARPSVYKTTVIYIRKRGFDEPLKSSDEILDDLRKRKRKG